MPVRQSMLEVLRNVTSEMSKSCCCCSNQAVFVLVQALHDEYPAAALIANTFGLLPCHAASGGAQSLLRESFARQAGKPPPIHPREQAQVERTQMVSPAFSVIYHALLPVRYARHIYDVSYRDTYPYMTDSPEQEVVRAKFQLALERCVPLWHYHHRECMHCVL
jgi:hypothetical protein